MNEMPEDLRPPYADDVKALHELEGGKMGHYVRGHVTPADFALAVEWAFECDVPLASVRHVWWRNVPAGWGDGTMIYMDAQPKSRGAYAVTVSEQWVDLFALRKERDPAAGVGTTLALGLMQPQVSVDDCRTRQLSIGPDLGCDGSCGNQPCGRCQGTGNQLAFMFQRREDCGGSGHARATVQSTEHAAK